jgi:uncharacterized protein
MVLFYTEKIHVFAFIFSIVKINCNFDEYFIIIMRNIKREIYLERLRPYYQKQIIKFITGQRRVGKSFLLKQVAMEIELLFPQTGIIFIDKEKFEFDEIKDYRKLYEYIKKHATQEMNSIFIDEIQEIDGFEKALRSLLNEGGFDIYCSGSNSEILSGELATLLSGRQLSVSVYSLSLNEFIEFHKLPDERTSLDVYIKYGGLPYLMHLPKEDELIFDYLNNINSTILYRDILSRYQIRDVNFLSNLIHFLADNTGSITVAKKIADYMKSLGNTKTVSVILNYLQYLQDSYLIKFAPRYDIPGKRIFDQGGKYYFQDHGLRNAIVGFKPNDTSKLVENLVHNHLLMMGYNVYVGVFRNLEIDFVAEKQGEKLYFQVAWLLPNEDVVQREFGNLLRIRDQYPKYVVSMDPMKSITSYEGINHLSLFEFLKKKNFN